jgi:hypothetical protein
MLSLALLPTIATAGKVRVLNTSNDRLLVNVVFAEPTAQGVLSHGWDVVDINQNREVDFPGNMVWLRIQKVGNNNPIGFAGNHPLSNQLTTGEPHQTSLNPNDNAIIELRWGNNQLFNWRPGEDLPAGWDFIEHFSAINGQTYEVGP